MLSLVSTDEWMGFDDMLMRGLPWNNLNSIYFHVAVVFLTEEHR